MTYADLLHSVPEELRKMYRKYENICKKQLTAKWSIEFNSTCLREDILPKYSRIKHQDPAVASSKPTKMYQRYLVEREIRKTEEKVRRLEEEKEAREG